MRVEDVYGVAALMLAQAVRQGAYRSVLFVSSAPQEGTSTAVLQVARLLHDAYGLRPLIVELGARTSTLAKLFFLDSDRTIQEIATGKKTTSECVQRTGSGLGIVPAACSNGSSAGWDVAALVRKILQDTMSDFDIVLLDAPPIPARPDGLAAAAVVPRAVIVVEAGRTTTEKLQRVKQELAHANVTVLGSILNKHRRFIPGWLYRWLLQ